MSPCKIGFLKTDRQIQMIGSMTLRHLRGRGANRPLFVACCNSLSCSIASRVDGGFSLYKLSFIRRSPDLTMMVIPLHEETVTNHSVV